MNQVAKKQENAVALVNDMFESDAASGMENMSQDDLALPFLKLLSQLSPELDSVEGAKAGMIFNTVSGKAYDGKEGLLVIPCFYERKYIEWAPRGQGSGAPVNIYPATSDIMTKTFRKPGDSRDYLESGNYVESTAQHYVIVCDEQGGDHPALIVMKSTQLKKSRKWNSMMMTLRMNGKNGPFVPPSFSHVFNGRLPGLPASFFIAVGFGFRPALLIPYPYPFREHMRLTTPAQSPTKNFQGLRYPRGGMLPTMQSFSLSVSIRGRSLLSCT